MMGTSFPASMSSFRKIRSFWFMFTEQHLVANGASEFVAEIFGEIECMFAAPFGALRSHSLKSGLLDGPP